MCKVVEPSSPSISEDAPKFLNQITSLHWKTNHTQRPFIEVSKVHFAELFFLCLWIMTKIQKALDTFLPHSVSGFFYPDAFSAFGAVPLFGLFTSRRGCGHLLVGPLGCCESPKREQHSQNILKREQHSQNILKREQCRDLRDVTRDAGRIWGSLYLFK